MNPNLARICVNACANCYNPPWQVQSDDAHVTVTEMLDATLVCFRGSKSAEDWINDGDVKMVYLGIGNTRVHAGFEKSFYTVGNQVSALIHKDRKIVVTGHSLGGAQAVICAALLASWGYEVDSCYTFGQPRVGDAAFAKWAGKLVPNYYRFVYRDDIVPRIPFGFMGYRHFGQEQFWSADGITWRVPALPIVIASDMLGLFQGWSKDKKLALLDDHHIEHYQKWVGSLTQ